MKNFRHPQRPKKKSLVIGRTAVINALLHGPQLDRVYLDQHATGKEIAEIRQLCLKNSVPVNHVPSVKLNGFNITNHEGCVGQISKIQYQQLQDLVTMVTENGEAPLILILDGITDIRNIGGIARTAYCCGVHGIVIPDKGVGALNEDAILTSAGALEKIPVCRVNSLMKAVDELHLNGFMVYATDMSGDTIFSEADFTVPTAIIMGSEDKGIHSALLKICDGKIKIPMAGDFESLNVSVATGIILYEAMKQRLF